MHDETVASDNSCFGDEPSCSGRTPRHSAAGVEARATRAGPCDRAPPTPAGPADAAGAAIPAHPPQWSGGFGQDRPDVLVAANRGLGVAGRLADPGRVRR